MNELKDQLSILVPLKGRENLTKRLLNYFTDIDLPFKIYFADGGANNNSDWLNSINYPKLDIHYHYYGEDFNINKWMHKMAEISKLIKTPYVITVDNDDFISLDGLIHGINLLNENKDYVSYRASLSDMDKNGNNVNKSGIYDQPSVTDNNPIIRIVNLKNHRNAAIHDIIYTKILHNFYSICEKSKTEDLQCMMTLNIFWQSIYGKVYKTNDKPYYYHQSGHSLVQGKNLFSKYVKWSRDKKFNDSMSIIISAISVGIHKQDNTISIDSVKNEIAEHIINVPLKKAGISDKVRVKRIKEMSDDYDDIFNQILEYVEINNSDQTFEHNPLEYNKDLKKIKKYI